MINVLARYVLKRISRVDPKVLCELKLALRDWNSKKKSWATLDEVHAFGDNVVRPMPTFGAAHRVPASVSEGLDDPS